MPILLMAGAPGEPIEVEVATADFSVAISGPSYAGLAADVGPIEVNVATADFSTPIPGIGVSLSSDPPADLIPDMAVQLYDGNTLISTLATASNVAFQIGKNEVGAGSFTLQLDDPDVGAVVINTRVRFYLYGALALTARIEVRPEIVALDEGEEASHVLLVTARGRGAELDNAVVFPTQPRYGPKDPGSPINAQHRLFGFASLDYPHEATWGTAISQGAANELDAVRNQTLEYTTDLDGHEEIVEIVRVPAPWEYPMPDAEWIWGIPDPGVLGFNYFRDSFTLTEDETIKIAVTADNFYTLYLDGIPLLGESENMGCWGEWREVDLTLPAGTYGLGVVVENASIAGREGEDLGIYNPGGCLYAVHAIGDEGELLENGYRARSRAGIKALAYPTVTPGFTPGEIVGQLIAEARLRGHLLDLIVDFSDTADSNGNQWATIANFSVTAGASILTALDGLVQQGVIDWRVRPGNGALQMFQAGKMNQYNDIIVDDDGNVTGGLTFIDFDVTGDIDTQNLRSQRFSSNGKPINRYMFKWASGYFLLEDLDSQAEYGIIEGFATVTGDTYAEAVVAAEFILGDNADASLSIAVSIDPAGLDDRPIQSFNVGDYVRVPNEAGVLHPYTVEAITVASNDFGRAADISLELNRRADTRRLDDQRLIQSLGKTLLGDTEFRNSKLAFVEGVGR